MYTLSDTQIKFILDDIRARGIEMDDLQQNLLDHVCCIIEHELEENGDFERFYFSTIQTFYKKELKEIETETKNLLTFKNYYAMKKAMITSGAISAAVFIIGSFFKIMHWPGTIVFLGLGFITFSFIFLPLMFLLKVGEINAKRDKVVLSIGTLLGILYCISMLFQVMHWPGKYLIWLSTLSVSFFVFLPVYFFTGIRNAETKVNTIVASILLVAAIGIQFTLTALRPSPETQNKTYAYIQSEQLLKKMQTISGDRLPVGTSEQKLIGDIQNTCQLLKELILKNETGQTFIPDDFELHHITISEGMLGDVFYKDGIGIKLLSDLKTEIALYNASKLKTKKNKIPVSHTILEATSDRIRLYNNLDALNDLTRIQMYLIYS
ncbi:MAG: hypothetical protein HYU69_17500 [Bacteroidetes bacterium]|nr:hypothetical protein [Bacteroidota bacterium]